MTNKRTAKLYQSVMFLPYFLSWIIVSYLAYSLFSIENGFINKTIIAALGMEPVKWYFEPKHWPFILTFFQLWKYTGYNVVVYLAAITGIDNEYFEGRRLTEPRKYSKCGT